MGVCFTACCRRLRMSGLGYVVAGDSDMLLPAKPRYIEPTKGVLDSCVQLVLAARQGRSYV